MQNISFATALLIASLLMGLVTSAYSQESSTQDAEARVTELELRLLEYVDDAEAFEIFEKLPDDPVERASELSSILLNKVASGASQIGDTASLTTDIDAMHGIDRYSDPSATEQRTGIKEEDFSWLAFGVVVFAAFLLSCAWAWFKEKFGIGSHRKS